MPHYQLTIKANQRPETLERLLRVIRHRGFNLVRLKSETDGKVITLNLEVASDQELHLLVNQLDKLFDVIEIQNESK